MAVDIEDEVKTEEEILKEEARRQKEEERELRRLELEERMANAGRRKREEEAEREKQEQADREYEEAMREDAERTAYSKSFRGRIANRLGRGKYQKPKPSDEEDGGKQATGQGGSAVNPITVNVSTGKETDVMTIVMILAAYAIWILDMSNFLGKPYKGFIFDPSILTRINWVGVATSGIVSLFLIYDILSSLNKKDSITYLISMAALFIINSAYILNIYNQAFNNMWINLIMLLLIATIIIFYVHKRGFVALHSSEQFTYWFMVLTYSFFWTMWNWTSNWKAVIHVFFITFFMLFYLKDKEGVNRNVLYTFTALFLIADFFGYSWDLSFPQVLSYKISFPIIVLLTAYYCGFFAKSTFGKINAFIWTAILIFLFMAGPQYAEAVGVTPEERQSGGFINELIDPIAKAWETFNAKITGRLDVATGGLYRAQVEKNQFEPLGVFLDKVRAAQPRFYPDEPVTIWSSIKSRTLSDPVTVRFNCYRYGKDNKRIGIKENPTEGKLTPDKPFTVFTLEEKDVECTFNQDRDTLKFQTGANPVTVSAQYNFVTSAYQEARFIDSKRYQAMIKENLDPLKEFGIPNKNPVTFYTNGPVELKVEVQQPITVDPDSTVYPNVVVVLANRDKIEDKQGKVLGQWQGKILNIEELVIVVPTGTELASGTCAPVPFKPYNKQDCLVSCRRTCREACDGFEGNRKTTCLSECDDTNPQSAISRKCDDECTILFKDEQGRTDYQGYQLNKDAEQFKRRESEFKEIGRFTQFGCRLVLRDVLELNVPVTRKYIRVRAKYNYLLESTYSVPIEAVPTPEVDIGSVITDPKSLVLDDGTSIPFYMIKGLVSIESKGIHCCQTKTVGFCRVDPYTTYCPDRILTSYNGTSIGIMQINNVESKSVARNQKILEELKKQGKCKPNEDIYERSCNIHMGLEILKQNYKIYKNSFPDKERLKQFCPPGQMFNGVDLYKLYSSYAGFDAVLRAYNGWGCNVERIRSGCSGHCNRDKDPAACIQRCIEHTVFYVDKVKERGKAIEARKFTDTIPELILPASEESEQFPPTG